MDFRYRATQSWHWFPWDWFQLSIPCYGPVHGYLCTILAAHGNGAEKLFLPQKPSLKELTRFVDGEDNTNNAAKDILRYCERIYGLAKEDRDSTPAEVLRYLSQNDKFMKEFDAILAQKVRLGYFD